MQFCGDIQGREPTWRLVWRMQGTSWVIRSGRMAAGSKALGVFGTMVVSYLSSTASRFGTRAVVGTALVKGEHSMGCVFVQYFLIQEAVFHVSGHKARW